MCDMTDSNSLSELVMSHTWMSHVTRMNECHTSELVISYIWMSHVTHMNESCHTWMSHVTHMNESCHTYEWVMSHMWTSDIIHICSDRLCHMTTVYMCDMLSLICVTHAITDYVPIILDTCDIYINVHMQYDKVWYLLWMRQVSYEWVISHMNICATLAYSCVTCLLRISHISHECVMSHANIYAT